MNIKAGRLYLLLLKYNTVMDWFSNSNQGQVKKLIAQLSDPARRDAATSELLKLGADAAPSLIDSLETEDLVQLLNYEQILARMPAAAPALTKALATAHPIIRGHVAEIFGMNRDRSAVSSLLDSLKGEYFTVRARAALALGNIGDEKAIPHLLPLLKDKEAEVRSAACIAIGKFKDPATFDEITNVLLDDVMIEVRQSAAQALGDTRHPAAIPFLMEALRDSFWWFEREQAVKVLLAAIEKMGVGIVEPLIDALNDKEGTVRKYAAMILGDLRDARAMEELGMTVYDLHDEVSEAAAEALAKFGARSVDILLEALKHPEAGLRERVVRALGRIQDVRVAPVLIEMLHDPERSLQRQAMQSLGDLKDRRALPALEEIAANRSDRELAAFAKQILESMK